MFWRYGINPDRLRDVLELLFAKILKIDFRPTACLAIGFFRNAHAAVLRELLHARRDVHAVAIDVIAIDDDLAEIYADAKYDPSVLALTFIARGHVLLNRDRALDSIDHAGKFDQRPVAHQLDEAAIAFVDPGINEIAPVRLQTRQGPGLVGRHQPAVADNVRAQDRGKPALDLLCHEPPSHPSEGKIGE